MKIKSGNISLDQLLKECDELIKRTVQIKNYKKSIVNFTFNIAIMLNVVCYKDYHLRII